MDNMITDANRVVHINNNEENLRFKQNFPKCIIFFGANGCQACDDIYPLYRRIANRYPNKIRLAYVDVDKCELDYTTVPYFVALNNEKVTNSMTGATSDDLRNFIIKCIKYKK